MAWRWLSLLYVQVLVAIALGVTLAPSGRRPGRR